jgi:hypothetical protein
LNVRFVRFVFPGSGIFHAASIRTSVGTLSVRVLFFGFPTGQRIMGPFIRFWLPGSSPFQDTLMTHNIRKQLLSECMTSMVMEI